MEKEFDYLGNSVALLKKILDIWMEAREEVNPDDKGSERIFQDLESYAACACHAIYCCYENFDIDEDYLYNSLLGKYHKVSCCSYLMRHFSAPKPEEEVKSETKEE